MLRAHSWVAGGIFTLGGLLLMVGCSNDSPPSPVKAVSESNQAVPDTDPKSSETATAVAADAAVTTDELEEDHGHVPGANGGIIVSLGRDSYHVEAIITTAGELRLHTLGSDESRVEDVEIQKLTAYVKVEGENDSTPIDINPLPQPGDGEGRASLFVAQLPESFIGQNIDVTVPNITIKGERFRLGFTTKAMVHDEEVMPEKVADDAERELYLTPGGIYTQADIEANGNVTASERFIGFKAAHDLSPKVGDKICPVTLTKANAKCTWIVGGKTYEFCCPPCVDEFVALAKTKPEEVKEPEHFVKREAASDSTVE